jgi:hypothetical protein
MNAVSAEWFLGVPQHSFASGDLDPVAFLARRGSTRTGSTNHGIVASRKKRQRRDGAHLVTASDVPTPNPIPQNVIGKTYHGRNFVLTGTPFRR